VAVEAAQVMGLSTPLALPQGPLRSSTAGAVHTVPLL
jgi:hypothetical protein